MTVINHKSISGITSITAPAGSDDLLTVHTNDTTERFRIVDSGAIVTGIVTATGNVNIDHGTGQAHYQITQTNGNTVKMGIVSGSDFEISGSSNNNIIFKRAGSTRLTITTDGATVAPNLTANSVLSNYGGIQTKLGFISGGAEGFVGTISNHSLFIKTNDTNRIKIANNSAATAIGTNAAFNAMLTVRGDISGALLALKATEDTNRLMVSGTDSNGVEVNLYDGAGGQKGILGVSGTEFFIKAPNNSAPLTFYTHNGSSIGERLRILSNGRISIGTNSAPRDMVHIHNPTANASSYVQFTNANTGGTGINDGTLIGISQNNSNTDGTGSGFTILNKENAEITLGTNGDERLRITSDGRLLLGTALTTSAHGNFDDLIIKATDAGSAGITIVTGTSNQATIAFSDGTSGTDQYRGFVQYSHNGDMLGLGAGGNDRLQIANDGTVTLKNNSGMMLDLQSSAGTGSAWIEFSDTDGTRKGYLGYGSSSSEKVYWVQQKSADMSIYSNGNDRFVVQSNGNKVVQNGRLNISSTFIDFSGSISAPATAAALFRPADNTLAISTANEERFRVDSTGNIHLRSASTNRIVLGSSGGSVGTLSNNENWIRGSGNMVQLNTAGGDYGFEVLGNQKMKLDTSGNLELRSATQCRVTFGSAGGSGNDTNWIRGDGDHLMFNCRTAGSHKWEINGSQKMMISQNGQLLHGNASTDQGWAVFYNGAAGGADKGTAGQDAAGDKGVNIRSDMGPTHLDLTGIDNYTLKLANQAYSGAGIANPQGTISKILFNTVTYNGWNSYGAICLDSQGTSGSRGQMVFMLNSGTSIMNEKLRITNTEINTANGEGLNVYGQNINHTNDAVLFASKTGNADWAIKAGCDGHDYGIYSRTANNASYSIATYDATNGAWRFRVNGNGTIYATNTSISGISDQRMKENIVDANSQWNDIKALRFRNFKWKADSGLADGKTYLGLISQEVEPISPNLVEINAQTKEDIENNVPDPEYKNVKYSIVWMKAVKALQEAQARIETLEAKVASLEGS